MTTRFGYRALRWAAVLALVSLALMVWGVIVPSPISLVIAMSVGQAFGTLSLGIFALVVLTDLRTARVFARNARRLSSMPPPEPPQS